MKSIYILIPPLFLLLVGVLFTPASVTAEDLVGRATVVDGDTIEIGGQRIRFNGIDAPESWQVCGDAGGKPYRCGKDAAFALDDFLSRSRPTRCTGRGKDRYERLVADCFRADGTNVNAWLVCRGWAVDWFRYSKGAFRADQQAAQSAHIGAWSGSFELPCLARADRSKKRASC